MNTGADTRADTHGPDADSYLDEAIGLLEANVFDGLVAVPDRIRSCLTLRMMRDRRRLFRDVPDSFVLSKVNAVRSMFEENRS